MNFKPKPLKIKIAYTISRIFDPIMLLLPLGIVVLASGHLDGHNRLNWALMLIFFLALLPILTVLIMLKKKKFNIEMEKRQDRTPFLLVIIFFWFLGLVLTWSLSGPHFIMGLITSAVVIAVVMLIINFFWKISGHAMMITVVSFLINMLYGWEHWWWLFILIPIVSWSRYVMKLHTATQLVAGFFMGGLIFIIMRLFGY